MDDWQKKRDKLAEGAASIYDYIPYVDELSKKIISSTKDTMRVGFKQGFNACEREMLKSHPLIVEMSNVLEKTSNYLNWNADNLSGDDLMGDGRLTAKYKRQLSEVDNAINKYQAAIKEE